MLKLLGKNLVRIVKSVLPGEKVRTAMGRKNYYSIKYGINKNQLDNKS
jgi:hypothetical protein